LNTLLTERLGLFNGNLQNFSLKQFLIFARIDENGEVRINPTALARYPGMLLSQLSQIVS
jgi:hypothetical protein